VTLAPGSRIGPYETLALLGAGGMGVVYRARDVNLNREIALKILPEAFVSDPDRLARFRREARLLASLSHPNIAAIYGFEEAGDKRALVLELVEGETLADRLARGALATRDALRVAFQIAEALEAAHDQGVVHRDLKPGNIKIRPDGTVKVLDFGLAKVARTSSLDAAEPAPNASMTEVGTIMGTAAYMAPEQARGQAVDRHADIWAFGCVLYEMLTGTRVFPGDTLADVITSVAQGDPDWGALPRDAPASIRVLLRRCLRPDVAHRLQHIGDARIEIEDALAGRDSGTIERAPLRVTRWSRTVPWAIASLAVALGAAAALRSLRSSAPSEHIVSRLELNLPAGVDLDRVGGPNPALSPDSTQVAFVGVSSGVRQVYVRRLDQFDATPLRGTEQATSCFFSPDGRKIAFLLPSGMLKTVALDDGAVVTLANEVDYTSGGAWGRDDRITFARQGVLWQMAASGGAARQLTTLDAEHGEVSHEWPTVIAGGQVLLFATTTSASPDTARIEGLSLTDHKRRVLVDVGTFPLYAPSGYLIYFRDGALLVAPFDASRLEVTGTPVRVVENVATNVAPLAAVSTTGSLVFAPLTGASSRLVWVSRQGAEQSISSDARDYRYPRLSRDGRRIVVESSGDLWLHDIARGTFARLTSIGTVNVGFPLWTPDSSHIVFRTTTAMRIVDADGSGRSELIEGTSAADHPNSVSPDGATLVFVKMAATGDLHALSLRGKPAPHPLLATPAYEAGAQFSPDGRWLAYVSDESGKLEVYVRPFPALDRKFQVSTQGGTQVLWSPNGKELFYRSGDKLLAVDVSTDPQLTLSTPRLLFERHYAFGSVTYPNYDVAPDGERFVMVRDESGSGRLNVVLNWSDELARMRPLPH
jgi:serine/threonine protein kinase